MWAQLGEIPFDILTAPDSFEAANSWDYAEHKIVGGKPKLQRTGQGLEEITLGYSLHVSYADPKASLARLKEAAGKKEPLALVMGSGEYRGRYVITSLTEAFGHTAPDGRVLAISGRISLKEHVGQLASGLGEAQAASGVTPAVAVKAVAQAVAQPGVKPWLDPNQVGELEAMAHDLNISPVEFADAHAVLGKSAELSGWKPGQLTSGIAQVSQAASKLGASGVGGLATSSAGLLTAASTARDPAQAVSMAKGLLTTLPSSSAWSGVQSSMQGDFFGAAAKTAKGLTGGKLDKLSEVFPTQEAASMARALITRQPTYDSVRQTLLDAAERLTSFDRALFAQPRSYSWMRDLVRFPTS